MPLAPPNDETSAAVPPAAIAQGLIAAPAPATRTTRTEQFEQFEQRLRALGLHVSEVVLMPKGLLPVTTGGRVRIFETQRRRF
ncbi:MULTISPECIES: hypothetical protein [unclassified Streptomyces]|uniref:hypothetical protein n=1 Tax=unclassified Streptomyces TaxID=2593676 RepID=UPI003802D0A8